MPNPTPKEHFIENLANLLYIMASQSNEGHIRLTSEENSKTLTQEIARKFIKENPEFIDT